MANDIGALWERTAKSGKKYLNGIVKIGGKAYPIVCFLNGYKKEAKHPDWKIYPSEPSKPREERESTPVREETNQAEVNNLGVEYPTEDIDPNEIPF